MIDLLALGYDVLSLSRIQFALTAMFHYLYPPLSIGLGLLIVIMEGLYLKTKNPTYELMAKFWTKIFAINFGMGVATGIVMEFEFGTNWAHYSRFVGDVFGSALAAEGIFAFFLESGFLAVLVFGWDKVSAKMHFFAACMVCLGSHFSAVWIVIANSWMQTPKGNVYATADGVRYTAEQLATQPALMLNRDTGLRAEITDFWALVFNPSSMDRLTHVILGAYILAAFFVMSISAWYILKNKYPDFARKSFAIALVFGLVATLAQGLSGDSTAVGVTNNQPAKLAAFEGVFKTEPYTPMYLFGVPDPENERVNYGVKIPGLLSFLAHRDFEKPVTGLDQFAPNDRPSNNAIKLVFFTYHVMITLAMYFTAVLLLAAVLWWRGKLFEKRWLMWVFVFSVVGPYIANQAGWISAEVGRQPWVVYGVMRTSQGVSTNLEPSQVLASLIMFAGIYTLLFLIFLYVLDRRIKAGPEVFLHHGPGIGGDSVPPAQPEPEHFFGPPMTLQDPPIHPPSKP